MGVVLAVVGFAAAAGIGALGRAYVIESLNTTEFPVGTLVVNAGGSLLAGIAASRVPNWAATIVGVAALGSFTTFSTFADEAVVMWARRRAGAAAYVLATVVSAVGAAYLGLGL
ncbi:MAG: fluoride efflux transporter FluC [Microthrixaceae bacterium]